MHFFVIMNLVIKRPYDTIQLFNHTITLAHTIEFWVLWLCQNLCKLDKDAKRKEKDTNKIMMCDLEEEKDANLVLTHLASRKVHKRAAIKMQL